MLISVGRRRSTDSWLEDDHGETLDARCAMFTICDTKHQRNQKSLRIEADTQTIRHVNAIRSNIKGLQQSQTRAIM